MKIDEKLSEEEHVPVGTKMCSSDFIFLDMGQMRLEMGKIFREPHVDMFSVPNHSGSFRAHFESFGRVYRDGPTDGLTDGRNNGP